MVDAIKTTVNRLELTKGRANDSRPANTGAPAAAGPSQVDDVMVSEAASPKGYTRLAEAPSIDVEAVRRIKDAIARGAYPIDVDRMSEALIEAYREMKS